MTWVRKLYLQMILKTSSGDDVFSVETTSVLLCVFVYSISHWRSFISCFICCIFMFFKLIWLLPWPGHP